MTEYEATQRLGAALNHLQALAAQFNKGDNVDEERALTANGLDVIPSGLSASTAWPNK